MDENRDDQPDRAPASRYGALLRNALMVVLLTSSGRILSVLPLDGLAESPLVQLLTAGDAIAAAAWMGLGLLAAAAVVSVVQRSSRD